MPPGSRPKVGVWSTQPSVMRIRMPAVCLATLLILIVNKLILGVNTLSKFSVNDSGDALRLICTLFLGPLVEWLVIDAGWRDIPSDIKRTLTTLMGWRTFIVVSHLLSNFRDL